MRNRLLSLLACGLLLSAGFSAYADTRVHHAPRNQQGEQLFPEYSGAKYYRSTDTAEDLVVSGPAVLLGLIIYNTGVPVNNVFAQIRDTAIAADGSQNVVARFRFDLESGTVRNRVVFPIRMDSGIAVDLSAASNGEEVTVLYLETD